MPKEYKISGDSLLKKIKELIKEGNVRRILIKNEEGKVYLEIPVNIAVLGTLAAPVLVAIGAIAALATSFTIEVIRKDEKKTTK